jgi:hypothetical protein
MSYRVEADDEVIIEECPDWFRAFGVFIDQFETAHHVTLIEGCGELADTVAEWIGDHLVVGGAGGEGEIRTLR